jgi:hypothetical protein
VKKSDLTGLAHTFRCAFAGVSRTFADLKVCASRFFHIFCGVGSCPRRQDFSRARVLLCGEHGTVKPLRVAPVEPVAYRSDAYTGLSQMIMLNKGTSSARLLHLHEGVRLERRQRNTARTQS